LTQHRIYCDTALEIYRGLADHLGYARCLVLKSYSWTISDEEALNVLQESLEIFRAEKDFAGVAETLCQMGARWIETIGIAQRVAWFEEGLCLHRERRDYRNIAVTSGELGYVVLRSGGDAACLLFEEMLAVSIQLKDRNSQSHALWLLGYAAMIAKDYSAAKSYFVEGLELIRRIGGKNGSALLLISLARAEWRLGQMETARILAEESLALYRDLKFTPAIEEAIKLLDQIGDNLPQSEIGST
jgi:tetratricopeptide (TPR) repeat protein